MLIPSLNAWRARRPGRDYPAAVTLPSRRDAAAKAGKLIGWGGGPLARLRAWADGLLYVVAPLPVSTEDMDAMPILDRAEVVRAFDAHLVGSLPPHLRARLWDWDRTKGRAGHHLNLLLSKGVLAVWGDACPNCGDPLRLQGPQGPRPTWALLCGHCGLFAEPVGETEKDLWGIARYFTEPFDDRVKMGEEQRTLAAEAYLADQAALAQVGRRFVQRRGWRDLPRDLPGDAPRPAALEVKVGREGWTLQVARMALFLLLWHLAEAFVDLAEQENHALLQPRASLPRPVAATSRCRWLKAPPVRSVRSRQAGEARAGPDLRR